MTTGQIILAIISSSVLAAILTSLGNWYLHKSNYRNAYYEKILDKRLTAFDMVQSLIGKLSIHTHLGDYSIPAFCFDEEFYEGFTILLIKAIDSSFWLDYSTSSKLTELNVFLLNNIDNKISGNATTEIKTEEFNALGKMHFEKIREFRKELQNLVGEELRNLHNIDKFFSNSLSKSKMTFEVYKI